MCNEKTIKNVCRMLNEVMRHCENDHVDSMMGMLKEASKNPYKYMWFNKPPLVGMFSTKPLFVSVYSNDTVMDILEVSYSIPISTSASACVTVTLSCLKKSIRGHVSPLSMNYYFSPDFPSMIAFVWSDSMFRIALENCQGRLAVPYLRRMRTNYSDDNIVGILRASTMNVMYLGEAWNGYYEGLDYVLTVVAERNPIKYLRTLKHMCILSACFTDTASFLVQIVRDGKDALYTYASCPIRMWDGGRPVYSVNYMIVRPALPFMDTVMQMEDVNTKHILPKHLNILFSNIMRKKPVRADFVKPPKRPLSPLRESNREEIDAV